MNILWGTSKNKTGQCGFPVKANINSHIWNWSISLLCGPLHEMKRPTYLSRLYKWSSLRKQGNILKIKFQFSLLDVAFLSFPCEFSWAFPIFFLFLFFMCTNTNEIRNNCNVRFYVSGRWKVGEGIMLYVESPIKTGIVLLI